MIFSLYSFAQWSKSPWQLSGLIFPFVPISVLLLCPLWSCQTSFVPVYLVVITLPASLLFNRPDLKLLLLLFFPLPYLSQLLKYTFTCSFIFFFQAVWVLFFSLGNYLFSCSGSIYQAWIPGWLEWWRATNSLHNVCFHDTCTIRSATPELHSIQFQSQDRLKVLFLAYVIHSISTMLYISRIYINTLSNIQVPISPVLSNSRYYWFIE